MLKILFRNSSNSVPVLRFLKILGRKPQKWQETTKKNLPKTLEKRCRLNAEHKISISARTACNNYPPPLFFEG
jgi:hypothetical protein